MAAHFQSKGLNLSEAKQTRETMKITRFEDLECWQEARKLVNMIYEAIRHSNPFQNDYRLKDQCVGAAISVMGTL